MPAHPTTADVAMARTKALEQRMAALEEEVKRLREALAVAYLALKERK